MILSFIIGAVVSVMLLILKIKKKTDNIAFGPFISLATLIYIFYGDLLIKFYIY